jgi:hypothetical protein
LHQRGGDDSPQFKGIRRNYLATYDDVARLGPTNPGTMERRGQSWRSHIFRDSRDQTNEQGIDKKIQVRVALVVGICYAEFLLSIKK